MTNVMGDALGCAIVQALCTDELAAMDHDKGLPEKGEEHVVSDKKGDIEMGSAL